MYVLLSTICIGALAIVLVLVSVLSVVYGCVDSDGYYYRRGREYGWAPIFLCIIPLVLWWPFRGELTEYIVAIAWLAVAVVLCRKQLRYLFQRLRNKREKLNGH